MTYAADDHAAIKARLDQIKSERVTAIAGEPAKADVPEPEYVECAAARDTAGTWGHYTVPTDCIDFMGFDYPHAR